MSEVFPRQIPNVPRRSSVHELTEDVVYERIDGAALRYDHYRTLATKDPAPCVVFVHGGGWRNGDPSQAAGNALHFARCGISTVSISYRLAPRHPFPAALHDVRRGLRTVRHRAEDLGIDPDRIALLGLSAGAHLALLGHVSSAVEDGTPEFPENLRGISEDVRAVVLHYGIYDLVKRRPSAEGEDPVAEFLGSDDEETRRLASPVEHAERVSAPVLLIHGTADEVVSHRQSVRMHEALGRAGRPSELLLLEGAPHAFQLDWKGEANRKANAAMDAFLDRTLLA